MTRRLPTNKRRSNPRYLLAALFLLLPATACGGLAAKIPDGAIDSGSDLLIAVASDTHYITDKINDHGDAFQRFVSSGNGSLMNYSEEIMETLVYDMKDLSPDAMIISGDLTVNGEKESHTRMAEKLRNIELSGKTRAYVIPGNHDILNPWARGFKGGSQYVTDYITPEEFEEIYADFGYNEAVMRDASSLSYLAAPSKDVWLLMLDTCVYKTNIEYENPAVYGRILPETQNWIRKCAELAHNNNARIIAVTHHNLFIHNYTLHYGYTLDNAEEAEQLFSECGIELVFSGHIHVQDIKNREGIFEVASSSLLTYPHQFGVLSYKPGEGFDYSVKSVDVERWAGSIGSEDANLLTFKSYAQKYYKDVSYNRTYGRLIDSGLYTENEAEEVAEMISALNVAYFSGRVDEIRDELMASEGYRLAGKSSEPEFLTRYTRSMLYDYGISNVSLRLP
ncbi:MAG: metallophosphoesterase [Clostridiales bacterium]|nr:metallophosphoesterase [Clostridiales bacterium]